MNIEQRIDDMDKRFRDLNEKIFSELKVMSRSMGKLEATVEAQNKMISMKTLRVLIIAVVSALGAVGYVKADTSEPDTAYCCNDAGVDSDCDMDKE